MNPNKYYAILIIVFLLLLSCGRFKSYDELKKESEVMAYCRLMHSDGNWQAVKILNVYRNINKYKLQDHLTIHHYFWQKRIPDGSYFIFIVPFGNENPHSDSTYNLWSLVGFKN